MGFLVSLLSKFTGAIPFLGPLLAPLLTSLFTRNSEVEETKAKVELVEAEAFKQGRVSPRYAQRYAIVGVFVLLAIAFVVALFMPGGGAEIRAGLRDLLNIGGEALKIQGY